MKKSNTEVQVQTVEVRSAMNDNVVVSFEMTKDENSNMFTAGFQKICDMLKINRVEAEQRYYVAAGK